MPPVQKTFSPAASAIASEAETVVTPTSKPFPIATERSRTETLLVAVKILSYSDSSSPSRNCPSITAVTAGTTSLFFSVDMHSSNASALEGDGKPSWLNTVDSKHTIGIPFAFAFVTSSESLTGLLLSIFLVILCDVQLCYS